MEGSWDGLLSPGMRGPSILGSVQTLYSHRRLVGRPSDGTREPVASPVETASRIQGVPCILDTATTWGRLPHPQTSNIRVETNRSSRNHRPAPRHKGNNPRINPNPRLQEGTSRRSKNACSLLWQPRYSCLRLRELLGLLLLLDLEQQGAVDVGQDTTEGDGGADEGVELFVTADGKLEMTGGDTLDLQVLGGVL